MARTYQGLPADFDAGVRDEAFRLNLENAPRGCPGYWCEWCFFTQGTRDNFQVDHILSVADAEKYAIPHHKLTSVDNACILCAACNQSKGRFGFPRHGTGLAYRVPNANLAWGERRVPHLDWDDLVQMAMRKGRFKTRG